MTVDFWFIFVKKNVLIGGLFL